MNEIRRVAVLGAGVMGTGIACHLANTGVPSLLYDMVPKAGSDRSALARGAIASALKQSPAPLYRNADASLIQPCNYDDDAALLASCDWIVEVVTERIDIKRKVFEWVAANRSSESVVTSNTSGIRIADMTETMPEGMRKRFLVTHFFNPVRYMRLLEIVTGPDTDMAVAERLAKFGEEVLGKGIVYGKDTPNFVANRVGTYGMASVFRHMAEAGLTVEQVDAIFGSALARPSSAVFRTADIVGLVTLSHVFKNLYEALPQDEEREALKVPPIVDTLIASGRTGGKADSGFYKKVKKDGKTEILVVDFATGEYRSQEKVRFDSIGKAKKADALPDKIRAMVSGEDAASKAAWRVLADTLIYAANRIPEIADDVVNIDRAMRWGFAWDLGPFETWDAMGVATSVERMGAEGRTVPAWVKQMLASGRASFYKRDEKGVQTHWQPGKGAVAVAVHPRQITLVDRKAVDKNVVKRTVSADLIDLGDGVLGLEFHSKMNALDDVIIELYGEALDKLDANEFEALVVGNQDGKAFCAGANLLMIAMAAMQGQWDQMNTQLDTLQKLVMRAKYSRKPVVTAPYGLTLGGGCEVAMHASATVALGELYMGLVEVGMGLIPGAGGCKEMVVRYLGDIPQDIDYDPNPFVQKAFERIGLAKVSTSAEEARDLGFLRPQDRVVTNADLLLAEAKRMAVGLVASGYVPPRLRTVKVPGPTGAAAIELFLYQMHQGGHATDHDVVVGKKLAGVLTGGEVPWGTVRTEQDLLDLERETFLSLAGMPATQARIQHFLQTGKPLRN